jgi:vitamin B12 transporter
LGQAAATEATVESATRQPTPVSQTGSSITVITASDLASRQRRTIPDALQDVPGLNIVQTGSPGGVTSAFIRGTNANHTKVLIDGIDAGDPTSFNGSFDFAHLLTSDVKQIEVLRGPQSGLYGSDAIGGVIDIKTKKGTGPAQFTGSIEGGSFGTFNQAATFSGASNSFNYAFNAAHFHTGEVPVTPLELLPPGRKRNDDSYDNQTYSARLGLDVTRNLDLGFTARYVETTLHFTGDDLSTFPSTPAATQSESNTKQLFTRATAHQVLYNGAFEQTFGAALTEYRRRDLSPGSDPSFNNGGRTKLDWQGNLKPVPGQMLTLGAEHQIDEIVNSPISAQTTNNAAFAQLQSKFSDRLFNTTSLRFDENDRFGEVTTYRVAPAFLLPETGTRLKASAGSGFKAPTLEQLFVSFPAFNIFANPNLKPEESVGYDFGFEQSVMAGRIQFGATYFHNNITNLIAFAGSTNINVAAAKTYGLENFAAFKPMDGVTLRVDYTYTIANDETLHEELLRRPKHKASAKAAWQATRELSMSATVIYVGSFIDGNRDFSIPRLKASDYAIVNVAASYVLGGGLSAFARIDNLFNEQYQDPTGFLRPGFAAYAGMKVALNVAELTDGK